MTILGVESPHKCKTCPFSLMEFGSDMFCQEGPPVISFITLPDPASPQGFKVQTVSGWPVVRPEQSCGRHPMRRNDGAVPNRVAPQLVACAERGEKVELVGIS